jgi:putative restriction endonuclease
MPDRTYGEIPNYPPGSAFINRRDLATSGVHRPLQGGICGGQDGAESIVVSGGYVDDEDYGNEIIYTGQGGRDPDTGKQIADQMLTLGNAGLARSHAEGYLVRVVRGAGGDRKYSPTTGLRYDGLFRIADVWHEQGHDGFRVWRFRLVAQDDASLPPAEQAEPEETGIPGASARATTTVQRIVRSTRVARRVKELHRHACQVCGLQILTPAGPYAEAAHIRALGRPHDGPDVESNVLCLCPNHHLMFDAGAIYVDREWLVRNSADHAAVGPLRSLPTHRVDPAQFDYHRNHHVP